MKPENSVIECNPVLALKASDRKEKYFTNEYTVLLLGEIDVPRREIITLRIYEAPTRTYACLWVYGRMSGSAWADGWGYHKASSATELAMNAAGIKLKTHIDGVGEAAMVDALAAIAVHLGHNNYYTHIAHA